MATSGRKKKTDTYDKKLIIDSIIKLKLEKCASQMTILNFICDTYGYKTQYAYILIKEADAKIVEVYRDYAVDLMEKQVANLEEQRESAKKSGEKKLVLQITQEINKITGMYVERIEHSGSVEYIAKFPTKKKDD
jgi:stalled ribosome rescue protein Dom34